MHRILKLIYLGHLAGAPHFPTYGKVNCHVEHRGELKILDENLTVQTNGRRCCFCNAIDLGLPL